VVKMAYQFLHYIATDATPKYILNVASTAAFQAIPSMAIYAATKAFVLSFSEALSEEVKHKNIAVSALCPGGTETEFAKHSEILSKVEAKNKNMLMSAESVAIIAVEGMAARKKVIIPGTFNKIGAFGAQLAPRGFVTRLAGKVFKV